MDWDLKIPSWDFSEFERESAPNISSLVGQSSLGGQKSKGNCSVDLKLGRFGDFGDGSVNKWKDPRDSTTVSSPMGSLKRARAPCSGTQTVSCLVEGCNVDLSKCRDYHRRHKVCEVHSKTPRVMVGGQEQRFCQQCSRFHSLVEFDEVKRSCRKRLDGHNRRRRKSQAESLSMNSGSSLSNHQGARLLPFSNPQVLPSTTVMSPSWIKTEQDTMPYNCYPSLHYVDRQNPFSDSFSRDYKVAGKQFPFLQANDSTLVHRTAPEASVCQPLLNTIATPETGGTNRKLFSNEFTRVLDSDCALSLLSSPRTQTSGISMNHVVQPDSIPLALPLVPGMQYNGLGRYQTPGMDDEPMGSVMVSDANNAEIRSQGIFHVRHDGSSSHGGVQETVPFSWE